MKEKKANKQQNIQIKHKLSLNKMRIISMERDNLRHDSKTNLMKLKIKTLRKCDKRERQG